MKRQNSRRGFSVQRLEDRRLLAADFSVVELAPVEVVEPQVYHVAEPEIQSEVDQSEVLDLDSTEISVDAIDAEIQNVDTAAEVGVDAAVAGENDVDAGVEAEIEPEVLNLGDPVDGTDGFFGAIDADSPTQSFSITPSEAGTLDIVVASSFGDAETRLEVTDSDGASIASSLPEELGGFQVLSLDVEAGENYELTVSSDLGAEGYFQVTVGHRETPEPVDVHADTIGEDSTELEFVDGVAGLSGELEQTGDIDTFRFTPESNGQISLSLTELDSENATELQVQVLDGDGEVITRGITNETVGISFSVEGGSEYFLAVSAGEDQIGSYQLDADLEVEVGEPDVEIVVDQHVDETGSDATELEFVAGVATVAGELETAVDSDAFQFVAPADGEVELVLIATSEDNAAEASVEVFDGSNESVVAGITNDDVGIVFDVAAGDSIQVLVDSVNDIPASYELTLTLTESDASEAIDPIDEIDPIDDIVFDGALEESVELDDVFEVDSVDDLIDEEVEVCFTDLGAENALVDSVFAEFDPASVFSADGSYELRRS